MANEKTNPLFIGGGALLDKIKQIDGSGSGIDADTLDGHDASYFALASALKTFTDVIYVINKYYGGTVNDNVVLIKRFWDEIPNKKLVIGVAIDSNCVGIFGYKNDSNYGGFFIQRYERIFYVSISNGTFTNYQIN